MVADPREPLEIELEEMKENEDAIFLLTNATFVCLMQCGFACLEAGSIRSKNVTNIMMKNILDVFISCLAFWLVGYAVAYGQGNSFIGLTLWAGVGFPRSKFAHWFFQFVFAATAATLVSGAVAERCNFFAYLVYSALISGLTYPIVAHWVWAPNGWLLALGYTDFAGSGPVHLLGGVSAGVGAMILGPRIGRFEGDEMPGHSKSLVGIGGLMLITGFVAFNGGSFGRMSTPGAGVEISVACANTVMAGTGGALLGLTASKLGLVKPKSWNFSISLNATFAGMVSVCASADSVSMWSSFALGIIGGLIYIGFHFLLLYCKIDDPLDATPVHLGGGIWGVLAGPIFKKDGLLYGPNEKNLMDLFYNVIGAVAIFTWSLTTSGLIFGLLKYFNVLRVSKEEELMGLDTAKHNESAYPGEGSQFSANYSGKRNGVGTARARLHDYTNEVFQLENA